jgi:hypothetical protein
MSKLDHAIAYHHHDIIDGIHVRPIYPGERDLWDSLIRQHHYLGLHSLVGKTLRYVAVFQGHWLALLGWQAAALKCMARDHWIGWAPVTQYQRLHFIANNARFLILPGVRIKNLASKILSLNLKRLSRDWLAVHGHPVFLAETFVETPRFTGACYRAANWQVLGQTRGFSKSGMRYTENALPKQILVYPLHPSAKEMLADPNPHPTWRWPMQSCTLSSKQMEDLFIFLRKLPDHRKPRGLRHPYIPVLTICIAALLTGAKSYIAIAEFAAKLTQNQLKRLRARFDRNTKNFLAPSEPTLRRVLQSADINAVELAIGQWFMQAAPDKAIALDGKTLKGARRENGTKVHLLSAFLHQQGVTVGQMEVGAKTNEIPMASLLLAPLDIRGAVITADAMHTQVNTARYIVEEKYADYLFIVKENQKNLLEDISLLDNSDFSPSVPNNR